MTRARVRRIGNSLGIVIPKAEARRRGLHEGDEVEVEIHKATGLTEVWGMLAGRLGPVDDLNDLVDEDEDLG